MNDLIDQIGKLVPLKYQIFFMIVTFMAKNMAEFYSSVKAGGGLRRIVLSFWFGEQVPKVIATDYKKELDTNPPIDSN